MLTIHDNEAKFVVVLKERGEGLCVEAVVAEVEGGVDWSERLKVNVDLLFLALLRDHGATVHDEAIGRHCNPFQTSKRERNKGEGGGEWREKKKAREGQGQQSNQQQQQPMRHARHDSDKCEEPATKGRVLNELLNKARAHSLTADLWNKA